MYRYGVNVSIRARRIDPAPALALQSRDRKAVALQQSCDRRRATLCESPHVRPSEQVGCMSLKEGQSRHDLRGDAIACGSSPTCAKFAFPSPTDRTRISLTFSENCRSRERRRYDDGTHLRTSRWWRGAAVAPDSRPSAALIAGADPRHLVVERAVAVLRKTRYRVKSGRGFSNVDNAR